MTAEMARYRAEVLRGVRRFFEARGFIEVTTPVRIAAPAPEPYIDCPQVVSGGFLRASPELQMKKLLADGIAPIFQIGPCFRDGERGSRHSPEFTMLEWYRLDATYEDIKVDLIELVRSLAPLALSAPESFETITVREAYRRYANWDPFAVERWEDVADRFNEDMVNKVEPRLAESRAVFLIGYPPQCASLAKVVDCAAQRWEFYMDGLELANCFTELTDAGEQERRFMEAREERRIIGKADYPIDTEFLKRLGDIKSAAGVALGIDRLVMALSGSRNIDNVNVKS